MSAIIYPVRQLVKQFALVAFASIFCATPALGQEQTSLETTSDQGTFLIKILWTQNELGKDNTFSISFIEPETGSVLEDIQYDLVVLQGDSHDEIVRRMNQILTEQKVSFDAVGPYTLVIEDIEGLGEDASVSFQVTPEFPAGAIGAVVVGTVAALLVVQQSSKSLFSQRN